MDGRVDRLGPFVAQQQPQWAVAALGDVPDEAEARAGWERTAGQIEKYRERYWHDPREPIGPEPAAATSEKRAAWHAAAQALGRPADGPDLRGRDTGVLWLMRDTYEAETAWAPRFVSPELRAVRTGAREAELTRARAAAESRAAQARGDAEAAVRQQALARSSAGMRDWYTTREAELAEADQDYQQWSHATEAARRQAAAADAELRRRDPGRVPGPLRSAEPHPVTEAERAEIDPVLIRARGAAAQSPGWVRALAEGRPAFREQLAERHSMRIPDPDPEYTDHGPAWPMIEPGSRDAIMQRPAPEMPAAPGLAPESEPEAGA